MTDEKNAWRWLVDYAELTDLDLEANPNIRTIRQALIRADAAEKMYEALKHLAEWSDDPAVRPIADKAIAEYEAVK